MCAARLPPDDEGDRGQGLERGFDPARAVGAMINRREFAGLAAAGAAVSRPGVAKANAEGMTTIHSLRSQFVPGDVRVALYRPPGYDGQRPATYPLLLLLHGGNGSEQDLLLFTKLIDAEILSGRLPPLVIAMPAARRSLYMDYRDGSERWESLILGDLLPFLRREAHVGRTREQTFIGGWSMGGLGSLRIAFKHPDIFCAVAALEPAIEPVLAWQDVGPRVKFWRPDAVLHSMFGTPIDPDYWASNNPATIASRDADRLVDLRIYLEVGDQDMLYLYEGAEFLHRILFDARLAHEYRLVHGADHVGPSLRPRLMDALGFIGRQILPPPWIDQGVRDLRSFMDRQKQAVGLEIEPVDPRRLKAR